jgi:hypothetical protein
LEHSVSSLKSQVSVLQRRLEYAQFALTNAEKERDDAWSQTRLLKKELEQMKKDNHQLEYRLEQMKLECLETVRGRSRAREPSIRDDMKENRLQRPTEREFRSSTTETTRSPDRPRRAVGETATQTSFRKSGDSTTTAASTNPINFYDKNLKQRLKEQLKRRLLHEKKVTLFLIFGDIH